MKSLRLCLLISMGCLLCNPLQAQHHPKLIEGFQHIKAQNWQAAVDAFQTLLQEQPEHQVGWFQLGDAYFQAGKYRDAANAYEKSESLGFFPHIIRYPIARSYAKLGDHDQALEWLKQAISAGFGDVADLKANEDLAALRKDSRFADVLLEADKVAHPCRYDARFDQFDFWIGSWDVFDQNGYRVGESQVYKELGGCALIEEWHSIWSKSNAKNYTFFNQNTETWNQTFIGDRAGFLDLTGAAEHGKVILQGPSTNAAGEAVLARLTFEPLPETKGAIQTLDHSKDDGLSWTNITVLSYAPKKKPNKTAANSQKP